MGIRVERGGGYAAITTSSPCLIQKHCRFTAEQLNDTFCMSPVHSRHWGGVRDTSSVTSLLRDAEQVTSPLCDAVSPAALCLSCLCRL